MDLKDYHGLEIKPLDRARAPEYKQVPLAKLGVLPRHPFRLSVCGPSHSGKSVLISSLLTRPEMYGNYFDKGNVIVISPTATTIDGMALDSTYSECGIPSSNIFHPEHAETVLERVFQLKKEEKKKKKNGGKLTPVLIILDDIVHDQRLLRRSKNIERCFTAGRHSSLSCILASQYWFGIPKPIRLQTTYMCMFQSRRQDVIQFCEDYSPPGIDHHIFVQQVETLLNSEPHVFITVNLQVPMSKRYRLKFNEPPLTFTEKKNIALHDPSKKRKRDAFEVNYAHKDDVKSSTSTATQDVATRTLTAPWSIQTGSNGDIEGYQGRSAG